MTCERVEHAGGVFILCQRGKRWPRCSVPGCRSQAPNLCDFPDARHKSGTCDAKLCQRHSVQQSPGVDYCPPHARQQTLPFGAHLQETASNGR